jgi:hypothetical protein
MGIMGVDIGKPSVPSKFVNVFSRPGHIDFSIISIITRDPNFSLPLHLTLLWDL